MKDLTETKEWTHLAMTADRLVSRVPCFVKHISLNVGTGGAGTVSIYNGVDVGGDFKLALSGVTSDKDRDDFDIPVYFSQGIYIDIGSNVTLFTIQYIEESKN